MGCSESRTQNERVAEEFCPPRLLAKDKVTSNVSLEVCVVTLVCTDDPPNLADEFIKTRCEPKEAGNPKVKELRLVELLVPVSVSFTENCPY
jgi:hypothetical protein